MELYSLTDADYLLTFYKDKVIGKFMDENGKHEIKFLEKKLEENKQYSVKAKAYAGRRSSYFTSEIDLVAKRLGLPSPEAVLKDQS